MRKYFNQGDYLDAQEANLETLDDALWVDIFEPDQDIWDQICEKYDLRIPDLDSLINCHGVSRVLVDNDVHVFVPTLMMQMNGEYEVTKVAFVLAKGVVFSFRFGRPECFQNFDAKVQDGSVLAVEHATEIFFELMQQLTIDYHEKIEAAGIALSDVSHEVLTEDLDAQNTGLHKVRINRLSKVEAVNSRMMSSLMGLSLLGDYLRDSPEFDANSELRNRFVANVNTLLKNGTFISDRLDFVLNAVMGIINLEQSRIVNVFSVFTVIFTIPCLLAGIWGMNFAYMPEMQWKWGYLLAWILIFASGLIPYWIVRKRGWL